MVTDEKPALVRRFCVIDVSDDVVVEILDGRVMWETSAGNHSKLNTGFSEHVHHARAIDVHRRIRNNRKAEPRARAVLALDDETFVIFEQRHEIRRVVPANGQHAVELLDLLEADSPRELEWPNVIAGNDKSICLEKRIVEPLSLVHHRVSRHIACPAMVADGSGEVIDFRVIRYQ